jgi:hypothetical protein
MPSKRRKNRWVKGSPRSASYLDTAVSEADFSVASFGAGGRRYPTRLKSQGGHAGSAVQGRRMHPGADEAPGDLTWTDSRQTLTSLSVPFVPESHNLIPFPHASHPWYLFLLQGMTALKATAVRAAAIFLHKARPSPRPHPLLNRDLRRRGDGPVGGTALRPRPRVYLLGSEGGDGV